MPPVAKRFDLSISGIRHLNKLDQEIGALKPSPHPGGRKAKIEGEVLETLGLQILLRRNWCFC